MIEIFDPRNGRPVRRVRFQWHARLICRRASWLDYARTGEGWV